MLHRKIGLVLPELVGAGRRLIESPQLPELYPEFLITSHGIIRASVPLMQRARDEAAQRAADDPVCAALAPYFDEHIEEERHHDDWLLDDLETLGRGRDDVLARPPTATIAGLVGAQYYWVIHYHPVAVLGYIALLEGIRRRPRCSRSSPPDRGIHRRRSGHCGCMPSSIPATEPSSTGCSTASR